MWVNSQVWQNSQINKTYEEANPKQKGFKEIQPTTYKKQPE